MSRYKIINLFDKIFISISIFLIIYAWINFFIRDLWATFFLSLIFSFAVVFLLFHILNLRNEKKLTNKKYLLDLEEKFLAFRILKQHEKLKLLNAILLKNYETKLTKTKLIYEKENRKHQILIATKFEKFSNHNLINLLEEIGNDIDVVEIICCDTENNINLNILNNLKIEIISKKRLYDEFFFPHSIFPNCSNLSTKKEKIKFNVHGHFPVECGIEAYDLCVIFSNL